MTDDHLIHHFSKTPDVEFDEAVRPTTEALKQRGFPPLALAALH